MCEPHAAQFRNRRTPIPLEQFLTDRWVRPLPPLPACLVLACTRAADGAVGYCNTHYQRWRVAQRGNAGVDEQWWQATEPGVAEPGQVNLRALPPLVVVEVLAGLQTRLRGGLRLTDVVLRAVGDTLRRRQAVSIQRLRSRPGSGQACPVGAARLHPRCPPGAGRPRHRAGQGHLGPGDLRPPRRPVVHQDHPAVAGGRRQAVGGRAAAPPPRQRRLPGPGEDQQCGAAVAAPERQARSRGRPGRAGPRRPGELPQPDRLPGGERPDQPLPPEHDLPGRAGGTGRDPRPGPGPGRPGRGRAGR